MQIRWTVFFMEPGMAAIRERLAQVVEQDDPAVMERLYVQHRYWRDPQLYRFGCEYAKDCLPEKLKEKVAKIAGSSQVDMLEKDNYLQYSCEATHEEMKCDPNKAYVVCSIYKDL